MTEQMNTTPPNSDERMMAALGHFFGLLASLIIYTIQKDKSQFVRFQAAQALAFDLITMLFIFVLVFCIVGVMLIGMFGTMFAAFNNSNQSGDMSWIVAFPAIFPFGIFACLFPFSLALWVTRMVATISVLNGNNFHYPWLGTKVENFLNS